MTLIFENQVPNICDGCGERVTIVHFKTKTGEWASLCVKCQQKVNALFFASATDRQIIKMVEGLKQKDG